MRWSYARDPELAGSPLKVALRVWRWDTRWSFHLRISSRTIARLPRPPAQ